jgi:signal transduction histidine kinase
VSIRSNCRWAIRNIYGSKEVFGYLALEERDQYQPLRADALDEHRLRRLIDVCRALLSELDLEVVLQQALEVARELTGARYVALGVLDERRERLERFLTLGVDDATREVIGELPRGEGVLGELIRNPRPLRLGDVTQHPRSYGFPPGHPPMRSFLGVPIMIRGEAYGNLYLTEKEGGEFDEADEQSVIFLADCASIAIDNARLYKTVWDRRDELERTVRVLRATTEIARALGGEVELDRVLELIVKRGRALVDASSVMILLEESDELVVAATAGEIGRASLGRRIPIASSLSSQALRSGRVERLADLSSSLRISPAELGVSASGGLVVPMTFRGTRLGVLAAFDRTVGGPEFRGEDEELMRSFAASATVAVATARSVAEERLRHSLEASEQERRRWARELHDETLQGLGALQVVLSSALRRGSPDGLAAAVRDAVDQLGVEIESLRSLITELRPAALDEIGLAPAIESLVERTATAEALVAEIELEIGSPTGEGGRLAPDLESTVYRLVQEALTNVAKHARAQRVSVRVIQAGGAVEVIVEDDGIGFDAEASHGGFGLRGMRERATLAGGSLEMTSVPGGGTTIRVRLPVDEPAQTGRRLASA